MRIVLIIEVIVILRIALIMNFILIIEIILTMKFVVIPRIIFIIWSSSSMMIARTSLWIVMLMINNRLDYGKDLFSSSTDPIYLVFNWIGVIAIISMSWWACQLSS